VGVLIREARARARPTPAVSVLFDDGDERSSIQAVIALGGFDWRPVSWSGAFLPDPAADIGFFTSHTVVNRDAFAEAARSGVSVLFGGGGGDEALPWGLLATAPASFAMRAGRWGTAARLLGRAAVRRLRVPRPDGPGASEPLDLLSPALGRRLDAVSRASEQLERGRGASPRAQHARLLEVKGAIGMREAEAALAARHGIELRSPFWDRRVVELCLAMPLALKEARDPPRYVLRRAMGSLLPAAVLSAEKWSAWPIYVEAARRIHREEPEPPGADGPLSELTHQVRVRDSWTAVGHPNPPPHCVSDVLVMASLQRQIESHGLH
jgi:asparagine synthase (glutamine-hydrolysing)